MSDRQIPMGPRRFFILVALLTGLSAGCMEDAPESDGSRNSDTKSPTPLLLPEACYGTWEVVGSSGGIDGRSSTEGAGVRIVIREDNVIVSRGPDGEKVERPFTVKRARSIYSPDESFFIVQGTAPAEFVVLLGEDGSMALADNAHDGISTAYRKVEKQGGEKIMSAEEQANTHFELGDELSGNGVRALQSGDTDGGREWFRQAISAYEAGLSVAPESDVLLRANFKLCIGARWFGLGDLDKARGYYDEVAETIEGDAKLLAEEDGADLLAQARLNRAEVDLTRGDVDAARKEIEEVLEKHPDHPYAQMLKERLPE